MGVAEGDADADASAVVDSVAAGVGVASGVVAEFRPGFVQIAVMMKIPTITRPMIEKIFRFPNIFIGKPGL
jgi:hypothetical protein